MATGLLNATLTDYAIGGATSGAVPGYLEVPASFANRSSPALVEVPSSLEQVFQLLLLLSYQSLLYGSGQCNLPPNQQVSRCRSSAALLLMSIAVSVVVIISNDEELEALRILQVANYLDTTNGTASPEDLYLVFIGANDYLDTLAGEANATVEEVLTATAEAMDLLYQAGARV